jgi:Mn2+/Fe2+ NRAMP family transporter
LRDYSLGTVCFCIYWYGFLLICGCAGRHSLFCRTMDAPDVQQSMGYKESRGGMPKFFHALGPALLISMGYIDLGKWVAAVEAGSCFGFDLVLLALLFNFTAIVCQYLAACIGTVTGKNLAEVSVYRCCSLVLLAFY